MGETHDRLPVSFRTIRIRLELRTTGPTKEQVNRTLTLAQYREVIERALPSAQSKFDENLMIITVLCWLLT